MSNSGLRKLQQSLTRVEAERMRLEKLAESLRTVIAYYEEEHEDFELVTPGQELKETIAQTLEAEGRAIHPNLILSRLKERGIDVPGKIPVNNVRAHMSGDSRFLPFGGGLWGLASWRKGTAVIEVAVEDSAHNGTRHENLESAQPVQVYVAESHAPPLN